MKAGWCWPWFILLLTSVPCTSPQASVLARVPGARTDGAALCHGGWEALMHPAWGFRGQEGTGWALWLGLQ